MAFTVETILLGNTISQYLIFIGILAGAVLAGKLITWLSKNILKRIAAKTKTKADDIIVSLFEGPVLLTVFIVALYFSHNILTLNTTLQSVVEKLILLLVIINATWYLIRFLDSVIVNYLEPLTAKTETALDDHLLPILKRTVNIVIIVIAAIIVIDKLGYNVSSLVAGLGLGGLAFALAAQDLLGNLFGGIAIFTDKPFKIGDTVRTGDVEGTVKEIGLRTTRIETYGGSVVVLPNRKVADSNLENISQEKARRVVVKLGLDGKPGAKKIEEAKAILRSCAKRTKELREECTVSFSGFGESGPTLTFVYWITKQGLDDYWGVQDRLYTAINTEFEKAKINVAFPTQTIYLRK
jgi:MscS family membrane protein